MTYGATENERLRDIFHFDGGLHAGLGTHLRKRAPQGQRVDHGREHAHVIRGRAIHAAIGCGETAPDVTAADYDRDLHAYVAYFPDALGDLVHYRRRNIVPCA